MSKLPLAYDCYFPRLLDIVMERKSLATIANHLGITRYELLQLLKMHFPFYQHSHQNGYIKIFKNTELVYKDFNSEAALLGSTPGKKDLYNITDDLLCPEFAGKYTTMDQATLSSKQPTIQVEPIKHTCFGEIAAVGHSTPVFDKGGDCVGVYIYSYIENKLVNMSFSCVLNYLHRGLAHYFIRQHHYVIKVDKMSIVFFARETECMLYLLVGLSAKSIARFMNISHRSVDGLCARVKNKLSIGSNRELADLLIRCHFLNQI